MLAFLLSQRSLQRSVLEPMSKLLSLTGVIEVFTAFRNEGSRTSLGLLA
jgi:hypothetical protein